MNLLQKGPLMIAISADDWEYYGGGIFSCKSTAEVNHAVLLVGYDESKWIIKNQWGKSWGENGYIYVTRNTMRNCQIGVAVH
jgi:C1A family cysteine protease